MIFQRGPFVRKSALALTAVSCLGLGLVQANEKPGMPDLAQIEQTCLPTSTANLMIWFGHHGYPKLLLSGSTEDERDLHTVHQIMTDTDARFDWGTQMANVTTGIEKYIHDAGYEADIEYRGMDGKGSAFSQDWLKDNDSPNKGFILLLNYCRVNPDNHVFTRAWNAGHAVTLVNAEPDMLLIHDPAHMEDETGRKIITPYPLTDGTWVDREGSRSVAGLLLLSGSLLEGPADGTVMMTGAVCVTMHPLDDGKGSVKPTPGAGPTSTLAGKGATDAPATGLSTTSKAETTWWSWAFDLFFKK